MQPIVRIEDSKKTGVRSVNNRIQSNKSEAKPQTDSPARDAIIARVLGIEGGFSDDARDSGGATNYGITQAVARAHGLDVRRITKEQAIEIYVSDYWQPLALDAVLEQSEQVAERLFDAAVNCGAPAAGAWLQRVLNVLNQDGSLWPDLAVDSAIGRATVAALDAHYQRRGEQGQAVLYEYLTALQGAHYIALAERRPKDEAFVYGWGGRLSNRSEPAGEYRQEPAWEPTKPEAPKGDKTTAPPARIKNPLDWLPGWKTHILMLAAAGCAIAESLGYPIPEQAYTVLGALGASTAYRGMTRGRNNDRK